MLKEVDKVIFFPDFHLLPGSREVGTSVLANLIGKILQEHSANPSTIVVLLGDLGENLIVEDSDYLTKSVFGKKLKEVLSGVTAVLIRGNHDPNFLSTDICALGIAAYADSVVINSGGKKFLVEHGDEVLLRSRKKTKQGKSFFDRVDDVIGKVFPKSFIPFFQHIAFNIVFPIMGEKYHLGAKWNEIILNGGEIKDGVILVTGHTHVKCLEPEKYLNPGAYNRGTLPYLLIQKGNILHFTERL